MCTEKFVPLSQNKKLQKQLEEYEKALGYFLDDYVETYGEEKLMKEAIKCGLSKEFIMREVLAERDLYDKMYAELIAEGEILAEEKEDE